MDLGKWFSTVVALPLLDVRRGTHSREFYRRAVQNLYRPIGELREEQWTRIRQLLAHAYRNVPHYHNALRARGLRPDDVRTWDDFRKLPVLDKDTIRHHPEGLRSSDLAARKPETSKTGGSTGHPLRFLVDRDSLGWAFALRWRAWGYGGFSPGDRRATIAGTSVIGGGSALRSWLQTKLLDRNLALPAIRLTPNVLGDYVRRMRAYRPAFLMGYPSALVVLCRTFGDELQDLGLEAAFTTAEMLYPGERLEIANALGCPVLDTYGANDGGVSAAECGGHPGFHVDMERGLLEVIADGEDAAPGERGEILATDLHNYSMPFIRYAIGDVATPGGDSGPCGRALPMLSSIEGRTTDFLILKGGLVVSGPGIIHLFRDFVVDDYLVEQESDSRIRIRFVPRAGGTAPETIADAMRRQVGPEIEIAVEAVETLARPPGTKRRFIVSSLPLALR